MTDATPYHTLEYLRPDGTCPFRHWLDSLDVTTRFRIQARIHRFERGNLGDHKSVGAGVWEARCDFGPGFRVYFGLDGNRLVILLVGGDKRSQPRDIRTAQFLMQEYRQRGPSTIPD